MQITGRKKKNRDRQIHRYKERKIHIQNVQTGKQKDRQLDRNSQSIYQADRQAGRQNSCNK